VAEVVRHLPSQCEAQNLKTYTTKKKEEEEKRESEKENKILRHTLEKHIQDFRIQGKTKNTC
jgi:ribosomal protein L9